MPPRLLSVGLLLYWAFAAVSLISRDLLPEWTLGNPPDLRAISRAEEGARPGRWAVQVVDDPKSPEVHRTVGQAMTEGVRRPDGSVVIASRVWFDAGGLLKGTPFDSKSETRIEVSSNYLVDPQGNLASFRARVRSISDPEELLDVQGVLKNRAIEITTRSPLPLLSQTRTIPYEPRGVVQNALGPIDRLPGLQIGQRWDTRVINPLTGRADVVRVEVTRRSMIHWNNNPVTTLEVVQHMTPLSARTWVRSDGLVLRQEVPFPFVKLVLERLPDDSGPEDAEVSPR
ncbi:MAG: hypothetical protein P4L84_06385 [Isosphaeraceae bacterium]|nr:hypothetical protein [Isosphaeraceae bacterium]